MLELAEIFRRAGSGYLKQHKEKILPSHRKAINDIEACRTIRMGGHLYVCDGCKKLHHAYHSCKNRHCPKCQNERATEWLQKQKALLLPLTYFLVTFTLPQEFRKLARSHQKIFYNLLFTASAAALKQLALDPKYIGGQIGMVGVLQTWTRDLGYHPHIHYIIPGGGLIEDQTSWLPVRNGKYFMPSKVLAALFKGKLFAAMKKAGLLDAVASKVWKKDWVIDIEEVGSGDAALKYLAPYIYRIALTNKRLIKMEGDKVTFKYKDGKTGQWRLMTLPVMQFIQRFLQHCLPKGFIKIRYYGFLSPKGREERIKKIRSLIEKKHEVVAEENQSDEKETEADKTAQAEALRCLHCGGHLSLIGRIDKPGLMKKVPP